MIEYVDWAEVARHAYEERHCDELKRAAEAGDAKAEKQFEEDCSEFQKVLKAALDALKLAMKQEPGVDEKFTDGRRMIWDPPKDPDGFPTVHTEDTSAEPVVVFYGAFFCGTCKQDLAAYTEAFPGRVRYVELADCKTGNLRPELEALVKRMGILQPGGGILVPRAFIVKQDKVVAAVKPTKGDPQGLQMAARRLGVVLKPSTTQVTTLGCAKNLTRPDTGDGQSGNGPASPKKPDCK